jgi:sn-glycerol 3-phosphate transport system permease protein
MVERTPWLDAGTHALLIVGLALLCLPIYLAVVAASQTAAEVNAGPLSLWPGGELPANVAAAWRKGQLGRQLVNSAVMAAGIAAGKIALSILSAFAVVYFRFPGRMLAFWAIFASLLLPVEVRIVPTYEVVANVLAPLAWAARVLGGGAAFAGLAEPGVAVAVRWSLLDSYAGLILPLVASATATFLFRQVFLTLPPELVEAAQLDGAGPLRFLWRIVVPLSVTNVAALGVILFVYGWNQYLWPLLVTTDPEMSTAVLGVTRLMPSMDSTPEWNVVMAAALVAMLPPVAVVVLLQRWFLRGLIEPHK